MTRAELRHLARLGAEDHLRALHAEIALIHRTFPDLGEAAPPANPYTAGVRAAVAGVRPAVEGAVKRRRPNVSAAGRKRIGDAAKRRWAKGRAQKDNGAASSSSHAPSWQTSSRANRERRSSVSRGHLPS